MSASLTWLRCSLSTLSDAENVQPSIPHVWWVEMCADICFSLGNVFWHDLHSYTSGVPCEIHTVSMSGLICPLVAVCAGAGPLLTLFAAGASFLLPLLDCHCRFRAGGPAACQAC